VSQGGLNGSGIEKWIERLEPRSNCPEGDVFLLLFSQSLILIFFSMTIFLNESIASIDAEDDVPVETDHVNQPKSVILNRRVFSLTSRTHGRVDPLSTDSQ
jgi:hypothetical protein